MNGDPRRSREDQLNYPSGLPDFQFPNGGDMNMLKGRTKIAIRNLHPIPKMRIYVPGRGYRNYNINLTRKQFRNMPNWYYEK